MPGNWHVRFGERRAETSRREAVWRCAPTLPFCCRAATIAASMAVLGPGSDRPAAVRPAAQRRTALAGFFVSRGMPPLRGRGKKPV